MSTRVYVKCKLHVDPTAHSPSLPQGAVELEGAVLSGDTIIVRPKEAPEKGRAHKERLLHIAGISAPRMGSMAREDEPFSFASREYLRALLVGKEVGFHITHTLPATSGPGSEREFVTLLLAPPGPGQPPIDVSQLIIANGWAKVRDGVGEGEEAVRRLGEAEAKRREALRNAEAQAKAEGKGVWSDEPETQRTVSFQMPSDAQAFIQECKGEEIDAIIEQVRDGTNFRVRLLLDDQNHQYINLTLAGAKSPRSFSGRDGESGNSEPWGEEAKFFTEVRLLQRPIKVRLLSAPASLGAPPSMGSAKSNGNGLPALPSGAGQATNIIGTAMHPNGNIAEFLCSAGLAKVIDWHAGLLAQYGGLDRLRAAEKTAKDKRLGVWEGFSAPSRGTNGAGHGAAASGGAGAGGSGVPSTKGQSFDAVVTRIWGSDQLSLAPKGQEEQERRVQLASVRGPRGTGGREAYYANEAKEFLRKRLIGKTVHVLIDYVKPREGDYEEKECVTITYGNQNNNIAEQLIEKGLATVLRHKRDDEERSSELDKLIIAEQAAVTDTRGVHSTKDVAPPRIVDASENNSRATQYLPSWKRAGRHAAVVDFVSAGSRFKLFLPKENAKITFVLAGIRAPRTARAGSNEKSEPYGVESYKFASRYLQRDVEVAFDSTDKQGGFIGAMYVNGVNVGAELVREGMASVHAYSAENLPFGKELFSAEEEAKAARKGVWSSYTGEEVQAPQDDNAPLAMEYLDVYVSAVKDSDPFGFSIQVLSGSNVADLEKLMSDFSLHHRQPTSAAPKDFSPRTGDLVSAKHPEDNQWYRAKVRKSSALKKEAVLVFIDYGNEETLPFNRIRPLAPQFRALPGQAQDARLSFVKVVPRTSEYGAEAIRRFDYLTAGHKLIANVDHKEGNVWHLRLIDPKDPNAADDPLACLNADIVREGLGTLDNSLRYLKAYPQVVRKIQDATEGAKADRLGIFEFGDVSED